MKLITAIILTIFSYIPKDITITVVDHQTKEELIGAKVKINDDVYYTDLNGEINVDLDEDKTYNVTVESITYETISYVNVEAKDWTFALDSK
jgi:hypothetical protein